MQIKLTKRRNLRRLLFRGCDWFIELLPCVSDSAPITIGLVLGIFRTEIFLFKQKMYPAFEQCIFVAFLAFSSDNLLSK